MDANHTVCMWSPSETQTAAMREYNILYYRTGWSLQSSSDQLDNFLGRCWPISPDCTINWFRSLTSHTTPRITPLTTRSCAFSILLSAQYSRETAQIPRGLTFPERVHTAQSALRCGRASDQIAIDQSILAVPARATFSLGRAQLNAPRPLTRPILHFPLRA
jgi:hypothetical protein